MALTAKYNMADMPLRWGHIRVLIVGSMEQLIGAGLSTVAGIIIPMLKLMEVQSDAEPMSAFMQGVLGASGLIGISSGSAVIGSLSDRYGYLFFFRLCPVLITLGSLLIWLCPELWALILGLFIIGIGVGGGYTLDTDYISEIMPDKWKLFMVGVAKATSSIGFFAVAGICWWILSKDENVHIWNRLPLIIGALGLLTLILRIPFRQSPRWLMARGETAKAQAAVEYFLGKDVEIEPLPTRKSTIKPTPWLQMFRGENLKKVIFSGIPWACEGVGVYGVGVFLPVLVMALGLNFTHDNGGFSSIISSVELTTIINFFIVPGFVLGLLLVRTHSHLRMLVRGFYASALGLILLLCAYLLHWPVAFSVIGFFIFEVALNMGPHLITFIIPAQIYDVGERGAGSGIAAMLGKIGAIVGVFMMPALLKWGGITLVLVACIVVSFIGGIISDVYGRQLMPDKK